MIERFWICGCHSDDFEDFHPLGYMPEDGDDIFLRNVG
jgi:hypothetical protein